MINTRHEEYLSFNNGLPFILNPDLERTTFNRSIESNWHENLEIQFCTEGSGIVTLDGKKYTFNKNDIVIVNSNAIHHTGTSTRLVYSCLIISTAFCKNIGIDPQKISFSPFINSTTLADMFKTLQEIYSNNNLPFQVAKLNEAVLKILIELAENHIAKENSSISTPKEFDLVKSTITYIRKNYNKKITLDEISSVVFYDKYALCRMFKRLTGHTIIEYLNSYRILKAIELLNAGYTVSQTAYFCGFENLSFFTKTFKRFIGKLPSEYKKRC